ncbi:hypothetical protein [Streptomyces sp. NPDC002265]|uniref:hypothetical protein n=1 Tax=Streptomyces sp. NPDC002265 TaxID=3154415 RepID=UPI003323D441
MRQVVAGVLRLAEGTESALIRALAVLSDSDNTFVVIQPDEDDPAWFASVAVLDEGGYEIVGRDTTRNEHEVTTANSINGIARDLTIWMAARSISVRQSRSHPGVEPLWPAPALLLPLLSP